MYEPDDKNAKLVCSYDIAADYEVDEGQLFLLSDGTYLHADASGCSCWAGDYRTENHATFDDFVRANWMAHGSDYVFEDAFTGLRDAATEMYPMN